MKIKLLLVFLLMLMLCEFISSGVADTPSIINLSPDSGYAGYAYKLTIHGEQFMPEAKVSISLDSMIINCTNISVQSSEIIICRLPLARSIPPGRYGVIVTNSDGKYEKINTVFTVMPIPNPRIISIIPSKGVSGATINGQIFGEYIRTGANLYLTRDSININATVLKPKSGSELNFTLKIPFTAKPGKWNVSIINPDSQVDTLVDGFSLLQAAAPKLDSIQPDHGDMEKSIQVTITGSNLSPGAKVNLSKDQFTIDGTDVKLISDKNLSCSLYFPAKVLEGVFTVIVTNPDGQVSTLPDVFWSGTPITPFEIRIIPSYGLQGTKRIVTIQGMHFLNGDTIKLIRGEERIEAEDVILQQNGELEGSIQIPEDASIGAFDVVVTSRYGKSDKLPLGFTVIDHTKMFLDSVFPNDGEQGKSVNLTVKGYNLVNGTRINLTKENRTPIPGKIIKTSLSEITSVFSIPLNADPTKWDLTAYHPDGKETKKQQSFRIFENLTPVISSIDPDRAYLGTKHQELRIHGNNFGEQDYIQANLSHDMYVIEIIGAAAYKDTLITGFVTIPEDAVTGWYNLTISRDNGMGLQRFSHMPDALRINQKANQSDK